jgi:hypothetical protein
MLLHRVKDVLEHTLALARFLEAFEQRVGRKGLDQVAVQRGLGGLGHLLVGGVPGDHDEDRGVRQHLLAPQFFQQVLPGFVAVVEVVVAQHHVVALVLPALRGRPACAPRA